MKEFRVTPQDDRIPDPRISLANERASVTRDNTLLGDMVAVLIDQGRNSQFTAIRDRSFLYDETYEEAAIKVMEVMGYNDNPPQNGSDRPKRRK